MAWERGNGKMVLTCTAQRSGKLLSFLRRELGMSSGLVKRLKYDHAFAVNGTAQYTNYPVQPGDVITVTLREGQPEYPAQDGPLDILYEDEALIALAVCAVTDPVASRAMEALNDLAGTQAHATVILSATDSNVYRRLGIQLTCEPQYETKKLYHR